MIFNNIVAPSITPGLEFTRPPVEESSFKPRTLDMKAKAGQTSRYQQVLILAGLHVVSVTVQVKF